MFSFPQLFPEFRVCGYPGVLLYPLQQMSRQLYTPLIMSGPVLFNNSHRATDGHRNHFFLSDRDQKNYRALQQLGREDPRRPFGGLPGEKCARAENTGQKCEGARAKSGSIAFAWRSSERNVTLHKIEWTFWISVFFRFVKIFNTFYGMLHYFPNL